MDTSEKNFEAQIEEHLTTHGFIKRDYHDFDAVNAIDSQMLFDFIYATQPEKWQKLETQHGSQVKSNFLKRLTKEIELRGTLDVFRRGVIDLGCKFDLTYFKPEDNLNPDHSRLYQANILTIMRQVHYSPKDTNKSLDTVVFLNGLPVFTIELKNPLTNQTVENAIWQYCHTRNPNDPLLKFGRCIAHFAVDTDLVYMTTHLQGENTRFLPFNQGNDKAAGNPINPNGFKTAYFWEQVLEGDSLLDILNNFAQLRDILDDKGIKTGKQEIIFPRYHQLDAVRKMVSHAQTKGTGDSYLIQHSAGSGKSETIAWLVLRLSSLKNAQNQRVFDSILVITDRTNLDKQLQRTIRGFNHVAGTITTIDKNKSTNLAKALEQGDDIIISTLQTFRFALEKMTNLNGKKFAVVIDEAHSSQSGESKDAVQKILSLNSPSNIPTNTQTDDEDEPDNEDQINEVVVSIQRQKGKSPHISYFAFTATPKDKTLEIFGIKVLQADGSKKSVPFSLYSMRQAIDEGFIKDVLQNYTTFACYFNLTKIVAEDPDYDKKTAAAVLKTYADEHEHAISMKTAAMVDHFHSHAAKLINGKAKAMIVTRSRLQAARYKLAFDSYLKTKGYPYKALVAFSGSVSDTEKPLPYLHTESNMNGVPESKTVETFQQNEYRFLIVARKFQTGFNQPLLQTMYVDKKLIGIEAVQTLSRLNRTTANKGDVFVLDFVNGTKDIEESFQDYYQATILSEATDPNKLYDLKDRLDKFYLFEKAEIETFASVYFPTKQNPKPNQAKLHPILNPMVDRYKERKPEEKADFRSLLGAYVRTYAFLVQILTFPDADLEKFYQFAQFLLKKLPINRDRLPIELVNHISMDSYKIKKTSEDDENGKPKPILLKAEDGYLKPLSGLGTGQPITENLAPLSEVLEYINEHYGTDFVHEDKLAFFSEDVFRRLDKSEGIYRALDPKINPSQETQKLAFETYFREILEDMIDTNFDIYKKLSDDTDFGNLFRQVMFNNFQKDLSDRRDQNLG